ncbi:MAG: arylesterase [Deltaproteobacteria bacterium]|nr:arylesterase [Deltaproteobacteria bacterium]
MAPRWGWLILPVLLTGCQGPSKAPTPEGLAPDAPLVLVLGDSLSAGFGVLPGESYPDHLQQLITQAGLPHRVQNAGVSGDTTAGGLSRTPWLLKQHPQVVVLELGANDGLRGLPPAQTRKNLEAIVAACQKSGAQVLLVGMKLPANYDPAQRRAFDGVYPNLAEKYHLPLVPFLLEGIVFQRELMQPDGIHPNAQGHRRMADLVWKALAPMLPAAPAPPGK